MPFRYYVVPVSLMLLGVGFLIYGARGLASRKSRENGIRNPLLLSGAVAVGLLLFAAGLFILYAAFLGWMGP